MIAPVEQSCVDPRALRDALGCFPTGVAIVTTLTDGGEPVGLTISSFNSASMDPPLVLWSLARKAWSLQHFRANPGFAINVLSADQSDACRTFATTVEDRFRDVAWTPGIDGVPLLEGSAASFECRTYARYDGGDHEIILGEVLRFAHSPRTPLVFGKGQLGALAIAPDA